MNIDRLRYDVEALRSTALEQISTAGSLQSASFFEGEVFAFDEILRRIDGAYHSGSIEGRLTMTANTADTD